MKKIVLLVLILLPLLLFAQMDEQADNEGTSYGMTGVVGSITIGDQTYSQIRLMPEIAIWKFGIGLDIDLLIDSDGNIRKEDWDEAEDYLHKLLFIRFAQRRDPFYFKIGSISNYTLGHGLIFNGYSNMLQYPLKRNFGGYVGVNTPLSGLGFEAYSHSIEKNEILGGRVFAKPLKVLDLPLLSNLKIGVNVGVDRNQYARFDDKNNDGIPDIYESIWLDTDGDGIPDSQDIDINGNGIIDHPSVNPYVEVAYPGIEAAAEEYNWDLDMNVLRNQPVPMGEDKEIWIYSVDYELPLIDYDYFKLAHYAELAMIKDYGSGLIFPGFGAKFLVFDANLEFRSFGDEFMPGFFDKLYDEQRAFVTSYPDSIGQTVFQVITKDETLKNVKASMGWYGSLGASLFDVCFLKIAYQDMYGEDVETGKSIWGTFGVDPKLIPKLREASISYSQTNVRYIALNQLKSPSANIVGTLSYGLSDTTFLVGRYSERYIDLDGNGKIEGVDETLTSMTFGVEFKF